MPRSNILGFMRSILSESSAFELLLEGDATAFDFYYHKYHQSIFANIFKIVQDKDAAQDILQDVFLVFWEQKLKLSSVASVAGWLFVVSYNKAVSYLKKKIKESTILLENPATIERLMDAPEVDEQFYKKQLFILEDAINHLPKRKKEVFSLCRFEGKSVEYAAETLEISVSAVKDYLKQSTRMIKRYIQENYPAELVMASIILFAIIQ